MRILESALRRATHLQQRTRYFVCDFRRDLLGLAAFLFLGFPSFISECCFGGCRSNSCIVRSVFSSTWGLLVMTKSKFHIRENPFEPRPKMLPVGDAEPMMIYPMIGQVITSWEGTEIGYSYLYATVLKPTGYTSPAARRAYGSIISVRSRKAMIESAAEVYFHLFPSPTIEQEMADLLNIYMSAASRRNDIAHGVIVSAQGPRTGWYLESNLYSNKRDVTSITPYAYTSDQMKRLAGQFVKLRFDVEGFRGTLKTHFLSFDPKLRAQY